MNNTEIYKKTLGFSLRRLMWDFIAFIVFAALTIGGFLIAETTADSGLIGLGIGAIIGGIVMYLILHYIAFSYKAGQIAMMTEGVVKGKLPENVIEKGKKVVKERFATVVAYYAVTGAIKGIFQQIGNGITAVGQAVGGDTGSTIGSTISSVIQTIVAYLCDCCLGWVFYRKDEKATKATLEGAVLFFKHGKTLAKNLGRVFGISILSFLAIGGVFGGIAYLILSGFPEAFANFSSEVVSKISDAPEWLSDPNVVTIICAIIIGTMFWSFLHSTFVRPFILVVVLRNYINSGINDIPSEKDFNALDSKSSKFKKLHEEVKAE